MNLEEIEKKLEYKEIEDEKVRSWKWKKPRRMKSLEKKTLKKPEHILVEYLTQKYTVRRLLCKVVGGNIVVIDNKVHIINPRDVWRDGKSVWYKIREIDRLPISNRDYDKLIKQKRITVNDAVVIKAIVGAIQKKEVSAATRKWIIWLIIGAVAAVMIYIFFFAK